jgi:hypothetical protein
VTFQWLKNKYSRNRSTGSYRSSHNDSGTRGRRRRKANDAERAAMRATQPLVTLVLLPGGKRRFVRETEEDRP